MPFLHSLDQNSHKSGLDSRVQREGSHLSTKGREKGYCKEFTAISHVSRDHTWFRGSLKYKFYPTKIRVECTIVTPSKDEVWLRCLVWAASRFHSLLKEKRFEICRASVGYKTHDICSFIYHFSLPLRCTFFLCFNIAELYILQSRKSCITRGHMAVLHAGICL